MKIFLDIGHPAHVHYFKHLIRELKAEGHMAIITARDKEMAHYLLGKEELEYTTRGKGSNSIMGKFFYLFKANSILLRVAKKEKPDLFLSFASPYCAQVARLMNKPCITLDDIETATLNHLLYKPFSSLILTPATFKKNLGRKQIRFSSFIEMAYLHPNRFNPDPSIYEEMNLRKNEKFVILRFVQLHANHDVGVKGITLKNKLRAIEEFSKYARVLVSSESDLPDELNKYKLQVDPERIHHVLAYASLLYGESATMASEAAALGTPAIFVNKHADKLGTIQEQSKKYGLIFPFNETANNQKRSIETGIEILKKEKTVWINRKNMMINDCTDITNYLREIIDSTYEKFS